MKNKLVILVMFFLSWGFGGCDNHKSDHLTAEFKVRMRLEKSVEILGGIMDITNNNHVVDLDKEICTLTNKTERARLLESYAQQLMEIDLGKLGFRQQHSRICYIGDLIWHNICGELMSITDADMSRIYDLRFQHIDWLRAQLHRMRPVREITPEELRQIGRVKIDWMNAYYSMDIILRSYLYYLENEHWTITRDAESRPNVSREELRDKVEKWLGHPFRSIEDITSDYKHQSDECKKVASGRYLPQMIMP